MTNSNTFGVHFVLRTNREQNGKYPVYARITVNGTRCEFSLKQSLYKEDWNCGKGAAKSKNNEFIGVEQQEINKTLLWLEKQHNSMMQQVLKKGSMKNYFTTEKYLKNFL